MFSKVGFCVATNPCFEAKGEQLKMITCPVQKRRTLARVATQFGICLKAMFYDLVLPILAKDSQV